MSPIRILLLGNFASEKENIKPINKMYRIFNLIFLFIVSCCAALAQETLTVSFTDSKGSHEVAGATGSLESLITNCEDGDKDITTVTALTVSGALNGADIKTLRQMAKGHNYRRNGAELCDKVYNDFDGWKQGSLETLNLQDATFAKSEDVYLIEYAKQDESKGEPDTETEYKVSENSNDIPENAFADCEGLTSVVVPTTVINAKVFADCPNLVTVTNKGNQPFTVVGNHGFQACTNLQTVGNTEGLVDLSSVGGNNLGSFAFFRCRTIKEVKLSKDLEVIEGSCFKQCDNLTTVNFQDLYDANKLKTIGYAAFEDSHNLLLGDNGVYTFPNSVEEIDTHAFANIDVDEVTFPSNEKFTTIKNGVFGWNGTRESCGTHGLKKVTIPKNVTTIEDQAFVNCQELTGLATTIDQDAKITSIGGSAFANNESMTDADLTRLLRDISVVNGSTFQNCKSLTKIDLTEAKTNGGIETVWGSGFNGCDKVTSINLGNKIGEVHDNAFSYCTTAETVDLGSATRLDEMAFGNDFGLKELTVNTATAPEIANNEKLYEKVTSTTEKDEQGNWKVTETWYDPFGNIPANQVTIKFAGEAANSTNYTSYRDNIAFKRLLTKHLSEDDEQYSVAPQMHGDVVLQRTFKAGYNTLAVPFGVNEDAGKKIDFYTKALFRGTGSEKGSHISGFRGTRGSVFEFLHFTDDTDNSDYPLRDFEPLLVYMDATDITAGTTHDNINASYDYMTTLTSDKQYYLFEDVNVNYDNGEVRTSNTTLNSAGDFNREGNAATIDYFKNNKSDYLFTGSYNKFTVDNPGATTTLKEGDYIIQDNKFFKVDAGKKYGMRGFRGWFTKNPDYTEDSGAKATLFTITDFNVKSGSTTGIATIDTTTGEVLPSADVFNLNGQCVRHKAATLEGLPSGIYIWNGRKIVVK